MNISGPAPHRSQLKTGFKPFPDRLHVVLVMHNPLRWLKRIEHLHATIKRFEDQGAIVYLVEVAQGDTAFEAADPHNTRHLALRSYQDAVWHKERMIKNAIQHLLPNDFERVMWADADISFARPDIIQETLHALERFHFVQPFSHAVDLGPNHEPLYWTPSFLWQWMKEGALMNEGQWRIDSYYDAKGGLNQWRPDHSTGDWKIVHPGLALATSHEALDLVGGIFDKSIFGSGDYIMLCALTGRVQMALPAKSNSNFAKECYTWQARAEEYILRDVGAVPGTVLHFWHGRKADRRYADRPGIMLEQLNFDPSTDIKEDANGLFQLTTHDNDRSRKIRDTLRAFGTARNEDSIDVD
jgi:hypothetical protein